VLLQASSLYSSQVFFYLLRRYRLCPARRVPRRSVTSYPTLVIRKSSERRFYLAQLELGCWRGVMDSVTGGRLSASMEENDDLPACRIIPYAASFITLITLLSGAWYCPA
jgi:hypothetical protein